MKYPRYAVESLIKRIIEQAEVVHKGHGRLVMNGRCPVCGDSKKSKNKKRFWVHEDDDWYAVTCYNCELRTNLVSLLKTHYPEEYEDMKLYCIEEIQSGNAFKESARSKKKENKPSSELHVFLCEFFDTHCIKLSKPCRHNKLHEKLRKFAVEKMEARNIKEKFWKDFYFCYKGKYKWRVIIPFRDENGLLYYFQGRDINPKSAPDTQKYLTSSFDGIKFPDNRMYNYYGVDETETVYACEGLLDSLFIDNALALCNANITGVNADLIKSKYRDRIWVLDNPWMDKTGYERALSLLEDGETCFIMPKDFRDCKDINDVALKMGVKKVPTQFIHDHTYSGSMDMMKLKVEMRGKWTT